MPFLPKKSDLQESPAKAMPPTPEEIARKLTPFCRENNITRLELFGSVARGDAHAGSDVDLVATFSRTPGFEFVAIAEEMEKILGTSVDLLTRCGLDHMRNAERKKYILSDLREIISLR